MSYFDMPYEEIAKDAISGKQVVVFCETSNAVDRHKKAIAAHAKRLGARHIVCPRRDKRIDIDNSVILFVLTNGLDGRGLSADVAYLSNTARLQHKLASLMGCNVK